jgi:protein TonB
MKSCALHGIIILLVIFLASSVLHTQGDILVVDFTLHDLPGSSKTDVVVTASKIAPSQKTHRKDPNARHIAKKEFHEITPGDEKAGPTSIPQELPDKKAETPVLPESAKEVSRNTLQGNDAVSSADARIPPSHEYLPEMTFKKGPAGFYTSEYAGESGYIRNNFSYIRDLIQRKVTYPLYARKRGWEGKVSVSFVISPEGKVSNVSISKSSGRDLLDKSALDAVRKASPFPPPPVHAMIKIPVIYRLHDP